MKTRPISRRRFLCRACLLFPATVCSAASPAPADGRDKPLICIDPGHPSEINDGLAVVNGTTENYCNWAVALKLRPLLERAGYQVVMTKRSEKQRVTNEQRARTANAAGAKLMVRLHCDSGAGTGFRVFYPEQTGRHNGTEGPNLWVRRNSSRAASAMREALAQKLKGDLKDNGAKGDQFTAIGKKHGALIGSIHSKVPTVLIEMVFLDNPKDAAYIKSDAGQQKMAEALADGVLRYVPLR